MRSKYGTYQKPCSQCHEFIAVRDVDNEGLVSLCYDCALELQQRYYDDFIFKMQKRIEKMKDLYEQALSDERKEAEARYNSTVNEFDLLIKDISKEALEMISKNEKKSKKK